MAMTKDEVVADILRRLDVAFDARMAKADASSNLGAYGLSKIHTHTADGIRRAMEIVREYQ
ncbi:hypothetical protein [Mycolicibacterium septicum]|uniref:hypothetical protein n=1 Tax=Mycolicibacterium septicum TaxID=98668 RepID=UPI001AF74132|nr:hypothetical protein [Mycolicibacterium septicum]QRY51707.1 hypothetical protein JVX95_30750 [Mycolicibacterium septicum]